MATETKFVLVNQIESLTHEIRGQKVMLDSDLAKLYDVETKALNRAVKRNPDRFPSEFMFQLTAEEFEGTKLAPQTSDVVVVATVPMLSPSMVRSWRRACSIRRERSRSVCLWCEPSSSCGN